MIFKGKKFSGNAYYRNDNGSILHGTLLYKTDIEQLVRTITPDNEKLISKGIESVRQRVINVGDYMTLGREQLMRHLENSIASGRVTLSADEFSEVCRIEPEYLSDEWVWGNNPPYTFKNKQRFAWGVCEVRIDVKGDIIKFIEFNGDFFTHQDLTPLYKALIGTKFESDALHEVISQIRIEDYILGATADDILSIIK